jgi:exosortase
MGNRITLLEPSLKTSIARTRWVFAGGFLLVALVPIIALHFGTISSALHLWMTVDTYSYAFAVLPISLFLVWQKREYFRSTVPESTIHGIPFILMFSTLWLIGVKADILELQHLAFPGVIVGVIICGIGWRNATHFWLPLGYLFLLAPAGTPLLPFLQDVAMVIATTFLHLGQVNFYYEGYDIEVVTGKYLVAPGCAGLNFVLAMAAVGPLYCEIMYTNFYKKLAVFACMMVCVPIANGFRVFGIIAIAEYTNRAIDISADHLFYGWVFFSAIVLFLFFVFSFFADKPEPAAPFMPWKGNYTTAELLGDPILIRMRIVLAAAVGASLLLPVAVVLGFQ